MPIYIDTSYSNSERARAYSAGTDTARESTSARVADGSGPITGSTVSGEIIEKEGDQVRIRLDNDQTIQAKLTGSADIEVGMRLTFEVSKNSENQTALRPLFANLANTGAAMSALKAAGLPVNSTTLAMTDRMMTESMPVNRNALSEMFRSVSANSDISPESIVQMTKLGMPITHENAVQFDNYRSFEHQITADLANVSEGIANLLKEAVSSAGESVPGSTGQFSQLTPQEVISEVLDLIDTENLDTIMPDNALRPATEPVAGEEAPVTAGGENAAAAETVLSPADGTVIQDAAGAGTVPTILTEGTEALPPEGSAADLINANISLSAEEQTVLSNEVRDLMILAGQQSDIHEPLDPSEVMKAVKELVRDYPLDDIKVIETQLAAYSEEGSEAADEGNLLNSAMNDVAALKGGARGTASEVPAAETIKAEASAELNALGQKLRVTQKLDSLLKSEGFSKLVKDSLKAQMSIKPSDVSAEKIDELYERIQRTATKTAALMETIGRDDSAAARSAGAINDNVSFMNQLNELVSYVQIPLKMAGEDANGELYVYTKKKNLSESDGNFTALLHLDMEHLGPMDVYVSMRDYTKVSTNFYLETEELLDFIASHIDELTKRLEDKGYNTSTKVTQKMPGEPITPITDEFTKDEANPRAPVMVSKMRFDVRA
ncbi:MAG: flagellar hook-length control protein FliK [Lachnospiraceae bacterium]|nr:flagellar hook-length control protein FliK [Lachnospiraceae bacterium]